MVNKKKSVASVFLLVVLISISFISAFGVSSPAKKTLYRGDSVSDLFSIQNGLGATNDLEVTVTLTGGSEIASLSDENVVIVPMGGIKNVGVDINIPLEAEFKTYVISANFDPTPVASDGGETIQFVTSYSKSFEVEVVPRPVVAEEEEEGFGVGWIVLIVLIIIAVIAIVIVLVRNKK